MNRHELRNILADAGVDSALYSLDGPAPSSESYSLVADGDFWKVLYKERGRYSEIQGGLSERQACLLIYRLLGEALGFSGSSPDRSSKT
jgi:hypothetical protein